jgi:hypothetical protein
MTNPAPSEPDELGTPAQAGYLRRWLLLNRSAWLYLIHAALLTSNLAMSALIFNLAITALNFPSVLLFGNAVPFLGVLGSLSVVAASVH